MTFRDQVLAALAPRSETVTIDGIALTVRELASAADVVIFSDQEDIAYKLLTRCAFDADGNRVFSEDDVAELKTGSLTKLAPLLLAARRVNGFDADDNAKN